MAAKLTHHGGQIIYVIIRLEKDLQISMEDVHTIKYFYILHI